MLGNALRGLPVNKKEQPKPLNRYGYPQLAAFKSTKAPGQYSTGTGGQYSSGANNLPPAVFKPRVFKSEISTLEL